MTIQELNKTQEVAVQGAAGALASDEINITAPGKMRVIKRNGKVYVINKKNPRFKQRQG